jgi:HSP20 family protein
MGLKRKSPIGADVFFDPRAALRQAFFPLSGHMWKPSTDIVETQDAFLLKMEIAGVPEDAIAIAVNRDQLIVRGCRVEERRRDVVRYHSLELPYGKFQMVFRFPFSLTMNEVKATCLHGLLSIEVPKRAANRGPLIIEIIELPE